MAAITSANCNGSQSFPLKFSHCFPPSLALSVSHGVSGRRKRRRFGAPAAVFALECPRPRLGDLTTLMPQKQNPRDVLEGCCLTDQ